MNTNYEELIINILTKYLLKTKNKQIKVELSSKLYEDLNFDSLDIVEFSFDLEKEFNNNLLDKIISIEISTVQDIVTFIKSHCDKSN